MAFAMVVVALALALVLVVLGVVVLSVTSSLSYFVNSLLRHQNRRRRN